MSRRELARDAGHGLDLLARRADDALGRAEVAEQRPLAHRADAAQLVEQRMRHRAVAARAVEVDREPVRLVADALEQPRRVRIRLDLERRRAARHVDLLESLGEADHGHAALDQRRRPPSSRR